MKIGNVSPGQEFIYEGIAFKRVGPWFHKNKGFYRVSRLPSIETGCSMAGHQNTIIVQCQRTGAFLFAETQLPCRPFEPADPPAVSDEDLQGLHPLSDHPTDRAKTREHHMEADPGKEWKSEVTTHPDGLAPSLLTTVPKVASALLGTSIELPRLLFEAGTVQCSTCRTWKDFRDYDQGTTMCPQCQKGE